MSAFTSSNILVRRLDKQTQKEVLAEGASPATRKGVAKKTLIFAGITFGIALLTYLFLVNQIFVPSADDKNVFLLNAEFNFVILWIMLLVSVIIGAICWIVCMFSPKATPYAGSIYAVCEGLMLGVLSLLAESLYPGIVFTALLGTAAVFGTMAALYYTGIVKVSNKLRSYLIVAFVSIILLQLVLFLFALMIPALWFAIYGNGVLSIIISVVMVLMASLMVLVNFSSVDTIVERGMDKKYEWTCAFSLLIVLIWLYAEILNLLMKLRRK